jgi:hypothetical protein
MDILPKSTSSTTALIGRKRRLSDADPEALPKRPRGLAVGPRLQAVSDPLPSTSPSESFRFDSWFQSYFNIPDRVTTEALDPSAPVEVELFTDWTLLDDTLGSTKTRRW